MAQDTRYFQFLAGPRNGEVVVFDKIEEEDGIVYVCFKDGSRCNEQLIIPINDRNYISQLMAEVDSPTNLWQIKEEWVGREEERWEWLDETNHGEKVCVQPFVPGKRKLIPIPPKPTLSKFGKIDSSSTSTPISNNTSVPAFKTEQQAPYKPIQSNSGDPVWMMCEKAYKFDQVINMDLKISLPKKALYDVAKESFEGGSEKVIEYIINNISLDTIKESLKKALLEAYEDGVAPTDPTHIFNPETLEEPIIGGAVRAEEEK